MADIMGSGGSAWHQWKKHGRCSGLSPDDFFALSREAYGRAFANDLVLYIVRHPLDVFLSQLNYVSANVTANPNIMLPCNSVEDVIARGDLDLYFGAFSVFGTLQPGFADAAIDLDDKGHRQNVKLIYHGR